MTRKPNSMYREITQHSYTRREYMGGVPATRIVQFDHGDSKVDHPVTFSLVVEERCQIRHTALDAARIASNRWCEKKMGKSGYYMKIRVYPNEVLRENKQAMGAGADRVSQGMRLSFGRPVGTAARVRVGQRIISLHTSPAFAKEAKTALSKAAHKLPTPTRIVVDKGAKLLA